MVWKRGLAWLAREWMLAFAASGLLLTSLALGRWPRYSAGDGEVLLALWALMVTTRGLERQGVTSWLAARLGRGRFVSLKLTLATMLLAALVTNDVALLALVPLVLRLPLARAEERVVLLTLAANAGSALTPFGNPQNLFIYWHYCVPPGDFLRAVAPLALLGLPLLAWAAALDRAKRPAPVSGGARPGAAAARFGLLAAGVVLVVLRALPIAALGPLLALAAWWDRGSLRVDYALLATFACFFGFTDQLHAALQAAIANPHHVFLAAALLSQAISNVPAALLLADFTPDWSALVWGVSVGGFGTLVASLANLIAFRVYTRRFPERARPLAAKMQLAGGAMWLLGALLYFAVFRGF